jgi:hypothetical protein
MITLEMIIAQLDRIHEEDGWHDVRDDGTFVDLTICDFEGFDEDWSEIDHEWIDEEIVEEVLDWLKTHADRVEGDFYVSYYFGDIEVQVGYTSFDI